MAFVNPSNLSFSPASPAPSSSHSNDDDHDDIDPGHVAGPARKRPRTSGKDESPSAALSLSEQRKEARAHRNRIAAQNSRDRRKAQFSYLERRVAELEDENRRLRAGVIVPTISNVLSNPTTVATATLSSAVEDHLRAEREKERERENEELKERIKTLERGWDAVVKALAAQGVAAGLITQAQPQVTSTPTTTTQTTQTTSAKLDVPTHPTFTAFPSPAPSHSSLDFESSLPSSSSLSASPITDFLPMVSSDAVAPSQQSQPQAQVSHPDPTRHLARVATTGGPSLVRSVSLQRVVSGAGAAVEGKTATADDNDPTMEALFREILASPRAAHSVVPVQGTAGVAQVTAVDTAVASSSEEQEEGAGKQGLGEERADADTDENNNSAVVAEWANEIEMQRMLDSMIMDIQIQGQDENGELGLLGLGEMDTSFMDLGLVAYDAGVVGDYARVPWEINGASVF